MNICVTTDEWDNLEILISLYAVNNHKNTRNSRRDRSRFTWETVLYHVVYSCTWEKSKRQNEIKIATDHLIENDRWWWVLDLPEALADDCGSLLDVGFFSFGPHSSELPSCSGSTLFDFLFFFFFSLCFLCFFLLFFKQCDDSTCLNNSNL